MGQVVGLTGGIGCGKSTVARMLAERGAAIIDADVLARQAVAKGSRGLAKIVERFGPEVVGEDGELDRPKVASIVFNDDEARAALNGIVHPEVAAQAMTEMQRHMEEGAPVIVYDVPLLYENGLQASLPRVIVVSVSEDVQKQRIAERDGWDEAQIQARIDAQMPLAEKVAQADFVIDNTGTIAQTEAQIAELWPKLQHPPEDSA